MAVLHRRFIFRELSSARRQAAVFAASVALSLVSLASLGGFSQSVNDALMQDARTLHAGDIVVRSHRDFTPALAAAIDRAVASGEAAAARVLELYSVVRADSGSTVLAAVKSVEPGYPFYGQVELESGRPLARVLVPGAVVVERALLDRLKIGVGDRLRLGDAQVVIADVLLREPDRPVVLVTLGPRLMMFAGDLAATGLSGRGSRVENTVLLKVARQGSEESLALRLRGSANPQGEHVDTFRTARSGIKRFLDNLLFFLNLIGIFTLLLAGLGIESSLTALLRDREETVAVMKVLGARTRTIAAQYLAIVLLLGAAGTAVGLLAAAGLQRFLPLLFRGLLPAGGGTGLSGRVVAESILLGLLVTIVFSALPLLRLGELTPAAIMRREENEGTRRWPRIAGMALVGTLFAAMILWRIKDLRIGMWFIAGTAATILVSWGAARLVLAGVRRIGKGSLPFRQAVRGLARPGNATVPVLTTLTAALSFLLTIALVERTIDADFISSYPPDAPNVFFLDIQKSQVEDFRSFLGRGVELYPVVMARVASINGQPISREQEGRRRGDHFGREFYLTYRDGLLPDERLSEGNALYTPGGGTAQVSILEEVRDMRPLEVGDVLVFTIQGVPTEVRVSSVRVRTETSPRPFFYFVFPPELLADAPQTFFAALRVPAERIAAMQDGVGGRFPTITTIDVTRTAADAARLMRRLSRIVRFFTSFSILAGMLILGGSLLATRRHRLRESVYFQVLGARRRFILTVFTLEHLVLATISALVAGIVSWIAGWAICVHVLKIAWHGSVLPALAVWAATLALLGVLGYLAGRSLVRDKPMIVLRELSAE